MTSHRLGPSTYASPGGVHANVLSTPSFEEVLRLQREEEEEDARERAVRRASRIGVIVAGKVGAQHHEDEISEDEEHGESTSTPEDDQAVESPSSAHFSGVSASSTTQPRGWLDLENANPDGETKKRWCELQRSFLFCAGRDKDLAHPKVVIDLKGCDVAQARGKTGVVVPSAFVLSHPQRPPFTFTAASETEKQDWMRALSAAIRAPTHALLSYKGRMVFDAEDAQAIASSQATIRGFVDKQLDKLACQKRDEAARLAQKKTDIKQLKSAKKSLARELIAATAAFDAAVVQSEELGAELEGIQRDGRSYELAQKQFIMTIVDLLNQLEDTDPNKLHSSTAGNAFASNTFSDGLYGHGWNRLDDDAYTTGSPIHSTPSSAHSSARRINSAHHHHGSVSDPIQEDEDAIAYAADTSASFAAGPHPRMLAMQVAQQQQMVQAQSMRPGANGHLEHPGSAFSTPKRAARSVANPSSPLSSAPRSGGSFGSGGRGQSRLPASSASFSPFTVAFGLPATGDSGVEASEERLEEIKALLTDLKEQALPLQDGLASRSMSISGLASSPTMNGMNGMASLPSFHSADALLTSRADAMELQEVKQASLEALTSNLTVRRDINLLTAEVERYLRKKLAVRALKASA